MLTACTPKTEPTPAPTEAPTATPTPGTTPDPGPTEVGKPDRIEITKVFYFGDSTENLIEKRDFMNWFTEEYGIKLVVNYPSRANYIEVINLSAMSGDLKGLVQMFSVTDLFQWANEGLLLPVTDLMAGNEVWETMIPEWWKETYSMAGEVWGLPNGTTNKPSWFARHIRGDWLDNLGLSKPDTIDELYEAIYKFTYNDPNKSGANDTIGMTSRNTWLMGDIFMAFDARLNYENGPLPNYNPNTELWEDPLLKPEMVDAITWLNKLYAEGALDPEVYSASSSEVRGRINRGYAGTIFDWTHNVNGFEINVKNVTPEGYFTTIGAIKGTTPANRIINFYEIRISAPYALMKGTPQAKEMANWFINIFFGSPEGNFVGMYGIRGNIRGTGYFTLEGNKIYKTYKPPIAGGTTPVAIPAPGLLDGNPLWEVGKVYEFIYYSDDKAWNESMTQVFQNQQTRMIEIFDEYDALGRLWAMPPSLKEPDDDLWLKQGVRGDQSIAARDALATAIMGDAPILEALAKYRAAAKALGMQQVLDMANEKLGATSSQTY
ncbi:MAG: extracellular solute-binding protein [Clostridia bacterium]